MRKRIQTISLLAAFAALSVFSTGAQPIGQWDFDNGDLAQTGTLGAPLEYSDAATQNGTSFGTTTSFGLPNIGGAEAKIMKFPAVTNDLGGYRFTVFSGPNGSDFPEFVNAYTLIMDVLFPSESDKKWRALLQVETTLAPDADFFVNPNNGIGVNGDYTGTINSNTWYRIGIVMDGSTGKIRKYINGVLVGTQNYGAIDDRFALTPFGTARFFADNDGDTALGYVNSIQLRDRALTTPEMRAMGAPTAAGVPQTIPPIPSGIEKFIPPGEFAARNTPVGAKIALGSTTIQDSTIKVTLNGVAIASPTITRDTDFVTVTSGPQSLTPGQKYTNVVTYTDSLNGAQTFTKVFTAALFFEDFESVELGPNVDEALFGEKVWTEMPPAGWSVIKTNMAGYNSPDDDGDGHPDGDGVTEWFGWNFADKDWWASTAGDQRRTEFTLASGAVAIADPDEWDDRAHDQGLFNSTMVSPDISLSGVGANSAFIRFASSWRPEANDDGPPNFPEGNINNQTAIVTVSYDGGAPIEILKWDSADGSPTYHGDAPNETITIPLSNPAGAQKMVLTFSLLKAANDWWWAVDNLVVSSGASAPTIATDPVGGWVSRGGNTTLSVEAAGTEPYSYQWKHDGMNIPGATGKNLDLKSIKLTDAGAYSVVVSNPGGSVESKATSVFVYSGPLSDGLVAHLAFDDNLQDSSGKGNNGAAVGSPAFQAGQIGRSVQIPSGTDYVSLGAPADLNFGTATDFSISFWGLLNQSSGDPSLIGNKNWNSGGNQGYVLFTESNRRIDWNAAGPGGSRRDASGVAGAFPSNTWAHVVVTFDRDGDAVTYVNGERREIVNIAGNSIDVSTPNGLATNIGQDGTGSYGSSFTDLRVDDLGIWRRVLTAQEVKAIFDTGTAGMDLSKAVVKADKDTLITGQWDFDNGDLSATVGAPLQFRGSTAAGTTFSTVDIKGQPAKVMGFPATAPDQGFIMPHGAAPNGGGTFVNQYTLIMDLMFPLDSDKKWRGLFQTSPSNSNDGDLFVNTSNGIGISGNYTGVINPDTWYRVAFVIDSVSGTLKKYIDGALVGSQTIAGVDGRFSLDTTALLFSDEDGETAAGFVNSIQFRDGLLTDAQIAALGGATAGGIGAGGTAQPTISVTRSGGNLVIAVQGSGTYQLQMKAALSDATWTNVGTPGAGPFTVATSGARGFFRVAQQ